MQKHDDPPVPPPSLSDSAEPDLPTVTREHLIAFWREVLEVPVGDVDDRHRLAQEVRYTYDRGGEIRTMAVKMPSKLDAAKELARLIGAYEPEKVDLTGDPLMDILARVRGTAKEG